MKPANEKKLLAAIYWATLALATGFMLYNIHGPCDGLLVPSHRLCN